MKIRLGTAQPVASAGCRGIGRARIFSATAVSGGADDRAASGKTNRCSGDGASSNASASRNISGQPGIPPGRVARGDGIGGRKSQFDFVQVSVRIPELGGAAFSDWMRLCQCVRKARRARKDLVCKIPATRRVVFWHGPDVHGRKRNRKSDSLVFRPFGCGAQRIWPVSGDPRVFPGGPAGCLRARHRAPVPAQPGPAYGFYRLDAVASRPLSPWGLGVRPRASAR